MTPVGTGDSKKSQTEPLFGLVEHKNSNIRTNDQNIAKNFALIQIKKYEAPCHPDK